MATIARQHINTLTRIRNSIQAEAENIVKRLDDKIIDFIKEKQLFEKGIDGKGQRLQEYTLFTKALKKQKGQPTNRTTLLDEEDFYDGFFVKLQGRDLFFNSTNEKTPELIGKYGKDIFTLTVSNNKLVDRDIMLKELEKFVLRELGKIKI